MRYFLVRAVLKILTLHLRAHSPGKAPVESPKRFTIYKEGLPEELGPLATAYKQVFAEPPWDERHTLPEINEKLRQELMGDSFLVLMEGNEEFPVGGFCWGAVIPVAEIEERVALARPGASREKVQGLIKTLYQKGLGNSKLLFLDELAVLRPFRGSLSPIQFLLRPGLELALEGRIKAALFWSSWESKIVPLAVYMGFEPVGNINGIIFLLNRDVTPLLKIAQNFDPRGATRIMSLTSRIIKKR